jgi:hypothetical protein
MRIIFKHNFDTSPSYTYNLYAQLFEKYYMRNFFKHQFYLFIFGTYTHNFDA